MKRLKAQRFRFMAKITGCHCCGLVQTVPPAAEDQVAVCARCNSTLRHAGPGRNRWTAALALAALAFYPPAMVLPMLHIERLGHAHEDSLLSGVIALCAQGHWFVGILVFAFSVLLPPLKLLALGLLSTMALRRHHRGAVYHAGELLGRWGMLDVMLVAILVAFVKLGDLVSIQAGPGLLAFATLVVLSLLASLTFNPLLMWEEAEIS